MGFLCHNSGSRHGKRSIKGCKDADDHLVSKTILSPKMAHWIGAQGQVKFVKNSKTCPFVTSPKENSKPKSTIFFNRN